MKLTGNNKIKADFLEAMFDQKYDVVVYRKEIPAIKGQTLKMFVPAKWDGKSKCFVTDPHCDLAPQLFFEMYEDGDLVKADFEVVGCTLLLHKRRARGVNSLGARFIPRIDLRGNRARLDHVNRILEQLGCKVVKERQIKAFRVVLASGEHLAKPYVAGAYTIRDFYESEFVLKVIDVLELNGVKINDKQ